MTDLEKAARMALGNICSAKLCEINSMSSRQEMIRLMDEAITALRQALEQPQDEWLTGCPECGMDGECGCDKQPAQQEPVGEVYRHGRDSHGREWHGIHWYDANVDVPHGTKLYISPQRKPWVGLTPRERIMCRSYDPEETVAKTEAKLKEKNA